MAEIFLISDTHFSHKNILTFKRKDGSPVRSFNSVEEMNETMVQRWNSVVGSNDKVYHLGDVGFFNATQLNIMDRLNGDKVLIKGNHDTLKPSQYLRFFRDIRASHVMDRIVLAHIPIHPDSLDRWKGQVHGHVHTESLKDPRYYNVSVEVADYTPVSFETVRRYFNE